MISTLLRVSVLIAPFYWLGCTSEAEAPPAPTSKAATTPPNVLSLTPKQLRSLNIQSVQVGQQSVGIPILVQGKAVPDHQGMGVVSAPISGRILRVYAYEGNVVRKGTVVADLESLEFATLAAEYLQSETELRFQTKEWERLQALYEKNLVAQSEVQRAEAAQMRAQTQLRASETKLTATGISRAYIRQWVSRKTQNPTLPVYAPVSGVIHNHNINVGQSVLAYTQMMDIVPTESVMVEAYATPAQAQNIRNGDEATIHMPGQNEVLRMSVIGLQASMDEERHAVRILLESRTVNGFPKPGQSVQVAFSTLSSGFAFQVPLSAIEYEGNDAHVFVKKADHQYERRPVKIHRILADMALVTEGLNSGESVAVSHVFTLKALSRMTDFAE